jgi:hypothetical protein
MIIPLYELICRDLNSSRESIATEIKASACEIPDSGWRRTRRLGVGSTQTIPPP